MPTDLRLCRSLLFLPASKPLTGLAFDLPRAHFYVHQSTWAAVPTLDIDIREGDVVYDANARLHVERQSIKLDTGTVSGRALMTKELAVFVREGTVALENARKSIATYKLRDGMAIGAKVTLRGDRMYEFVDRLVTIAIPRIRDFRGLNARAFDGRGNYSLGIREQLIFPEIDYDSIDQVRGLDVAITTSAKTDEEAYELLRLLGMPFSPEGRPGEEDTAAAEEEERRHEEARLRAEAEQAALEQLKAENPEAYERKVREPEEGEEGEEGAEGDGEPAAEHQSLRTASA